MRVIIVANDFPERSETFIVSHAMGLRRRGHDVLVLARRCGSTIEPQELSELSAAGLHIEYTQRDQRTNRLDSTILSLLLRSPSVFAGIVRPEPWSRQQQLSASTMLARMSRWVPDVVHIHYGTNAHRLVRLAGRRGLPAPALVTWHGFDANAMPEMFGPDLYAGLFSTKLKHTVGSDFVRRRLVALGGGSVDIRKVPMGVDINRYLHQTRRFDGKQPLRLLSVGRLAEVKGHAFLIDACRLLRQRGRSIEVRIVGDGPLRSVLERRIQMAGLQDSVQLLGALPSDQVVSQYQWAHLFALTGVREDSGKVESQGLVYAEAQASGLPVIGSRLGGVPDSMEEGASGFLCAPGDSQAIADAIDRFFNEPTLVSSFGLAARAFVESQFTLERMLDQFESIYAELRDSVGFA